MREADHAAAQHRDCAARNKLNAHYTDPVIVSAMWDTLTALAPGPGGVFLEPGCGRGSLRGTQRGY